MSKYRFGFELEGFRYDKYGQLVLPNKEDPVDGFPGLVELRTRGAEPLATAFFNLVDQTKKPEFAQVTFMTFSHTFSAAEKQELRKRKTPAKQPVSVENLYGRKQRLLGNETWASFQISFSRLDLSFPYDRRGDAQYGLFDYVPLIRKLDALFAKEIKVSKRQPGVYAVKGPRVEYRSLPNSAFQPTLELFNSLQKVFDDGE